MAYQVDKFNGTPLVTVADGTIDTTTDLRFLGKNYAGYGEVQNENFLHLLENFANTSAPPKAINGQIWFDSANKKLKYYDADNTKWRTTGGLEVSSTAPTKMNVGDFWWDTSAKQLYSWDGNAFVLIGPQPTVGGSQTATDVAVVKGTDGLNYNIVKLLAGAGETVAVVSNDAFTLDNTLNPIPGFSVLKKGLNLVNTDPTTGVKTAENIFWGTASDSDRLGGVLASEYVQKGASSFTSQVAFPNAGYTVGIPGNNLAVFIELGDQPVIETRSSARLTLRIREDFDTAYDILEVVPPTATPGAAIPGINNTYDLGSQLYKWKTVYSTDFVGNLAGNVVGNITGVHTGNVLASDDSTAYNATTKVFTGSFTGILTGNVIGDVTGTASNAFTLNNLQPNKEISSSTVVIRTGSDDSSGAGNIKANKFIGTADKADLLLIGGLGYISGSTNTVNNSIVVRDSNGNIAANLLNGTATSANSLQADGGAYRTASVNPIGNTIVVRDAAGFINVNGITGSATSANQLQVDGTAYRLASTSAVANTIVSRDSTGAIRAVSIQNTPIGTTTAAQGAFTLLSASGAVSFTNTTASVSTSTGAVTISGGLGVAGSVYATSFNGTFNGNAATATNATNATNATTATVALKAQNTVTGTNAADLVYANMADNDLFRIRVGGTASNAGWVELATADDGTEPIYVRQYNGVFATVARTATLLDGSGNTSFPGTVSATSFTESSSIALKENVNPITDALDKVLQLCGVTYDRKDGSRKSEAGLIAEQVNEVIPEIVSRDVDGNPEGIQYSKLTAYLIEAVKSLKAEIDHLKGNK